MKTRSLVSLGAALLLGACAHTGPVPERELDDSRAALRAAESVNADANPQAAAHMRVARDRLDQAEEMISDGDGDEAKPLLEEAIVESQIAAAIVEEAKVRKKLGAAKERVQRLEASARAELEE